MIEEDETFGGSWPFEARYFEGQGFRHHFIDEGRRDGPETFVCLHGEPTWGYIYQRFVPRLGEIGRVIVPDHMGFGKSETPQGCAPLGGGPSCTRARTARRSTARLGTSIG